MQVIHCSHTGFNTEPPVFTSKRLNQSFLLLTFSNCVVRKHIGRHATSTRLSDIQELNTENNQMIIIFHLQIYKRLKKSIKKSQRSGRVLLCGTDQ